MSNIILGLLAETFIHSGIGRTEGAIDLPVAREAATDFPFIPGSSLKGSLRDFARRHWSADTAKTNKCFGDEGQHNAGGVLISDARLLLLPVRSLTGSYRWVTCSHLLERLYRDFERSNIQTTLALLATQPDKGKYFGPGGGILYLEERSFTSAGPLPAGLVGAIEPLVKHSSTAARLENQVLILNDSDFSWFARYALAIQARNVLEKGTKKSKNLWYEESLPPDTLLYGLLGERNPESGIGDLSELLQNNPYFQTGGNETVGQGWLAVSQEVGS